MKTFRQQLQRRNFTLIELVVSMGVFSILMLALMMFFNGSQKIWTESEKRNAIYADGRVAMDLICGTLQNALIHNENGPIYIKHGHASLPSLTINSVTGNVNGYRYDEICFLTDSPMPFDTGLTHSQVYKVGFYLDQTYKEVANSDNNQLNNLCLRYATDDVSGTSNFWGDSSFSYLTGTDDIDSAALAALGTFLPNSLPVTSGSFSATPYNKVIIQYVLGLEFNAMYKNSSGNLTIDPSDEPYKCVVDPYKAYLSTDSVRTSNSNYTGCPYAIQVKLTLIDQKTYYKWIAMGGDGNPNKSSSGYPDLGLDSSGNVSETPRSKLLQENQRTFTRIVYLGNRF